MNSLHDTVDFCKNILLEASDMLANSLGAAHQVKRKGPVDLVTEMDLACEKFLKQNLEKKYPNIHFFGEEEGGNTWKEGLVWVVDPLDGTTNYANAIPHFSISLALCEDGEPIMGVVAAPMSKDIYCAIKGGGATLNGKKISVTSETNIGSALCATGFPYDRTSIESILKRLEVVLKHAQGVRRFGSAALDLCYVARGLYSFFWEETLKPWDIAAGILLVNEAGGKTTKYDGSPLELDSMELLASNSFLHNQIIELLKL